MNAITTNALDVSVEKPGGLERIALRLIAPLASAAALSILSGRLLHRAEAGCTIASLQSSEMGESIYGRMGFRRVASYPTYGRVEEAGG